MNLQYRPGDPPTWLLTLGDGAPAIVTQDTHRFDLLCEAHALPASLVSKAMKYPGVWWSE